MSFESLSDFMLHTRCINYYTGKQVRVSEQGRHYHVAGCGIIDDSDGPYNDVDYHQELANESEAQYVPCSCAFELYQEALHAALTVGE